MNSREEAVSHREYWDEASRPLAGLVLLAPLLLIYEWHAACQDSSAVITLRNGVDIWLRTQMGWLGFDHEWCVPALVLLTLAGRHILSCQDWNIRPSVIGGMMAEAALFAALLVILGQLIPWSSANIPQFPQEMELLHSREALLLSENTVGNIAGKLATPVADAWPNPSPRLHWVTCLGAGIYEEFLFRLGLIPVLYGLVRMLGIPRVITLVIAIGASSLLLLLPTIFRWILRPGEFRCWLQPTTSSSTVMSGPHSAFAAWQEVYSELCWSFAALGSLQVATLATTCLSATGWVESLYC